MCRVVKLPEIDSVAHKFQMKRIDGIVLDISAELSVIYFISK